MKKIAVLFEGDIHRRLGVFNAVISRVKHLQQVADYKIDVHMFQVYDGWLMRRVRHSQKTDFRPDEIIADGVKVHITWFFSTVFTAWDGRCGVTIWSVPTTAS